MRREVEYSNGDMGRDSKHRLTSTLLVTLPALLLGNVPSSSFEPYVKAKKKKGNENKVTSNFISLYKTTEATEASLICAVYSQTNSAAL